MYLELPKLLLHFFGESKLKDHHGSKDPLHFLSDLDLPFWGVSTPLKFDKSMSRKILGFRKIVSIRLQIWLFRGSIPTEN